MKAAFNLSFLGVENFLTWAAEQVSMSVYKCTYPYCLSVCPPHNNCLHLPVFVPCTQLSSFTSLSAIIPLSSFSSLPAIISLSSFGSLSALHTTVFIHQSVCIPRSLFSRLFVIVLLSSFSSLP